MKLELHQVSKRFGDQFAVNDCSLQLGDTQSLVIIGPSGSGKSTLLRMIGGLERATSGRVLVNGRELQSEEAPLREYRRTVGTVFQAFNLFPHLTALANVTLPLEKVHGL